MTTVDFQMNQPELKANVSRAIKAGNHPQTRLLIGWLKNWITMSCKSPIEEIQNGRL